MSKVCTRCEVEKPVEGFYSCAKGKYGRHSWCKECFKGREYARRRGNPEKARTIRRKAQYATFGMTVDQWDAMLERQGGSCAACGGRPTTEGRTFAIDHDHECCPGNYSCGNCVRGLLCNQCNVALGLVRDDPDRLMRLAEYVLSNRNVLHLVAR